MKKDISNANSIITSFVFIFGIMQIIFVLRNLLPMFNGYGGLGWREIVISLVSAVVFGISHFVITAEGLDGKASVKRRVILCGIPCTLIGCVLAGEFGIQKLLPHIANINLASAMWVISYLVSIGIYVAVFFLIELRYRMQGQKYNAALDKYKKRNR